MEQEYEKNTILNNIQDQSCDNTETEEYDDSMSPIKNEPSAFKNIQNTFSDQTDTSPSKEEPSYEILSIEPLCYLDNDPKTSIHAVDVGNEEIVFEELEEDEFNIKTESVDEAVKKFETRINKEKLKDSKKNKEINSRISSTKSDTCQKEMIWQNKDDIYQKTLSPNQKSPIYHKANPVGRLSRDDQDKFDDIGISDVNVLRYLMEDLLKDLKSFKSKTITNITHNHYYGPQ